MRQTTVLCAVVIVLGALAGVSAGQDQVSPIEEVLRELQRLRERVGNLEKRHETDQERIRRLEDRLGTAEPNPSQQPPPSQGQATPPVLEPTRPAAPARSTDLTLTLPPATGLGQGNLLNPRITAIFDLGGSLSTNQKNKALNRFNLREAELDFRAAVTPWSDGVLILAIGEEIEETADGIEIDTVFELEEGYINFHTLPFDLTFKAGKFRNAFGRNNLLHTHALPQVTRPLAVRSFLGPEGLATVGGSLSWLVPNPWDKYIELTAEVVNANGGEESPILAGPNADNPAFIGHLKFFDDVGDTGSIELGGSYLYARTSDDDDFDANVFGLDATYQWLDPEAPDFRSLLLHSEFFWAQNDIQDSAFGTFRNNSFGYYAFGQYQFDKNWYAGVRFDYTEFPNVDVRGPEDSDWAVSPYLTWYLSEFLRFRLEYQHREFDLGGAWDDEDNLLFGLTFSIGADPPHPYWVNR
ncbi:MAG: hypothetical protein IID41_05460 [Planctomycetes bacterium]|nr:hypothetical protein [Planctomycetota bacterium]